MTQGDPGGIGGEVLVRALADPSRRARARFLVLGLDADLRATARALSIEPFWATRPRGWTPGGDADSPGCDVLDWSEGLAPGSAFPAGPTALGGRLSLECVRGAMDLCRRGVARALCTGPISKEAWSLAGEARYPGHTELLAQELGAKRHAMMFESPRLRVLLATTHVPLSRVAGLLTPERVLESIELAGEGCSMLGLARARLGVAGLNPHAGEGGLLGSEDRACIAPAVARARELGIDAVGPLAGDTVFRRAWDGEFDAVVAMYHDQGLAPLKLVARDEGVNFTVGLPFPRTSPDHGTAYDIAGRGLAHAGSMGAALDLAVDLAHRLEA